MIITAEKTKGMNVIEVIEVIQQLSHSQGFYGRILETILDLKENDEEGFEAFKNIVEAQEFKDPIDVVMFFET